MTDRPTDIDRERGAVLVTAGTGKTGRRVVQRLRARGVPVRAGSRSGHPRFDWGHPATWQPALQGAWAAYITYVPDLAATGAPEAIEAFTDQAVACGLHRLVLLSGRGEEEAQRSEQILRKVVHGSDTRSTVVRASWFSQNFSENFMLEMVRAGEVALPAGDTPEPFIDVEDIADVVTAALTEDGHADRLYEVTGPRLLTFARAVEEIGRACGRELRYVEIPLDAFISALHDQGVPADVVELLAYLFGEVLDGRNAWRSDGVQQALGREPADFADYALETARTGVWDV